MVIQNYSGILMFTSLYGYEDAVRREVEDNASGSVKISYVHCTNVCRCEEQYGDALASWNNTYMLQLPLSRIAILVHRRRLDYNKVQ